MITRPALVAPGETPLISSRVVHSPPYFLLATSLPDKNGFGGVVGTETAWKLDNVDWDS